MHGHTRLLCSTRGILAGDRSQTTDEWTMSPSLRFLPFVWVTTTLLIACTSDAVPPAKRKLAMNPLQEPLVTGPTVGGYTYTNAPQLTRLGPHRFMIPANYFTDQMGPDFQGGALLEVVWPGLKAAPPGHSRQSTVLEQQHVVRANLDYIDKQPLQAAMDTSIKTFSDDPILRLDPMDNLDQRTRVEDVFGLERWVVTDADKARYLARNGGKPEYVLPDGPWDIEDWYVRRDAQGHILSFLTCPPLAKPDGLIIQGEGLVRDHNPQISSCSHSFAMPEYSTSIRASYPRVLMRDWARIESTYRELFHRTYIGTDKAEGRP